MAERVTTTTQPLKRAQISKAFTDSEAIRFFEDLVEDLTQRTPGAVNGNADQLDDLQQRSETIEASANAAIEEAVLARALAEQQAMATEIAELRARVDVLARAIENLQEAPR